MQNKIIEMTEKIYPALVILRRDFHQYPELGWCEMRTSSIIARRLKDLGFDEVLVGQDVCDSNNRMGVPSDDELERQYQRAVQQGADQEYVKATRGGYTGVIGVLHCGEGPTVALRFDIDALPLNESTDKDHYPNAEEFISRNNGVMHACGHDGHTTIGLGVAEVLIAYRDQLHGTLKLIFQPAEEGVRGAKSIVEKGHLDGVDYVLGAHLGGDADVSKAMIGAGRGSSLATTKLDVTYLGRAVHAAVSPEAGKYAMLAAATAILNLHAIPRFGAAHTRINVGKLEAGTSRNIVCDHAKLEMEVRGNTSSANNHMLDYALRTVNAAAAMHDCEVQIDYVGSAQCTENSPALTQKVLETVCKQTDIETFNPEDRAAGSEDYSYMSECVQKQGGQSCYFMNVVRCAGIFHSTRFDFDEIGLANGVKAFSVVACELLS